MMADEGVAEHYQVLEELGRKWLSETWQDADLIKC